MCETVKDEALALIDSTRHMSQMGDTMEDEDSMETDSPRGPQKDQRDGVSEAGMMARRGLFFFVFAVFHTLKASFVSTPLRPEMSKRQFHFQAYLFSDLIYCGPIRVKPGVHKASVNPS